MHTSRLLAQGPLLVVAVALLAAPALAQSFGPELKNTLTPAAGGMAGTSVARPQDLVAAINGNPATLTQYRGTQFLIGGAFAGPTMNIEQTGNIGPGGTPIITPFSAKSGTPGAAAPNIGVIQDLSAYGLPVTLGLGMVGAAGAGTSFIKQPQSAGTSTYLSILEFAASAGVKLTDKLSLGSTLFVGDGYLDGPFVGLGAMTNAYALRGTVGLSYDVTEFTTLGLYYQTRQHFRFKDEVRLDLGGGAFDITRDVHLALPDTVGMGIANSRLFDGRLLLAADVLLLQWQSAKLFEDIYRNQWVLQVGSQYKLNDKVKLRLGYAFAENPIDPSTGTMVDGVPVPGGIPAVKYLQAQFAVINQHRFTAGAGVADILPGLDFDTFAGGMFEASEQLGPLTRVSVESYFLGLGFTWRFDRGSCSVN